MILNVLGWIEVCIFARGILQMELSEKKRNIFWAVFILVGSEIFYTVCPNENIGFVVTELVGHMLSFLILFRGTPATRIVKYWFCVFYMNIFYIPIDFIVDISTMGIQNLPFADVRDEAIEILIILLEVFIAIAISKRKRLIAWIQFVPLRYYCLGIICGFCVTGINTLIKYIIEDENEMTRIVIAIIVTIVNIFLYGIGIGFAFVDVWREQYKQENVLKDEYLRMSREHYEGLVSHMREIRSIKHDMQAHTNVLEEYIRKKEWEKAESYLWEMKEHLSFQSQRLINVGNELVDAVLADGIQKNGVGIEFVCEGILPQYLEISDFDLCTIFSNLLSNSLEACERLQEKEKRILLHIKVFQDNLLILMENPVEWEVEVEKLGSITSKKDRESHGFGILNVKRAAEKYGGDVEIDVVDSMFQVKLLLYEAVKSEQ